LLGKESYMGARLLPRNLPELFSYSLVLEREAAKRYAELERCLRGWGARRLAEEFERLGREEQEQYELIALGTSGGDLPKLAGWELGWYFGGESLHTQRTPRSAREALAIALAFERRAQAFYNDVAANARADAVRAFAAEMSTDEQRHIACLEALVAREAGALESEDVEESGDGLPLT
jgi:bacterioferritin (cytochrome b1)